MLRCTWALPLLAIITFSSASLAQTTHAKPSDIPVEAFAALPNFSNPKLSPDGKKLAYFIEVDGRRSIVVQKNAGTNPQVIGPHDKAEYANFYWKNDEVLLLKLSMSLNYYFNRKRTDTRILSLDLTTTKFRWLGRPKSKLRGESISQHDSMIDFLPDDPEHILLSLDLERDATPTVFKVNVRTGNRKTVQHGRKGIVWWKTDNTSEVRLGRGYKPNSKKLHMKYKTATGDWIDLTELDWTDKYDIEGFAQEPDTLYVSGKSEFGTAGLFKLQVLTGTITENLIANKSYDISGIYMHPITDRLAGVYYTDDYNRVQYFDEDLALIQRSLNHVLPGTNNYIISKAKNRDIYLILRDSDKNPGDYYVYDREHKSLAYLMSLRVKLDENLMAATKSITIPMRDGTEIPGYMTIPQGADLKNLPTIILPHGGPEARDTADWDYQAQFYASRGWLVLKPNFRGSTGFGKAFHAKGVKQWGGLMQDDVTDATKWLISEGITNPDRLCIVGSSYGGYAALFGTIKEPGLYKCAISINGVADIKALKAADKNYIGGKVWIENMGMEGVDDDEVSPHQRADDISAPVLLIAATDDARVNYKMSKKLYKKLKRLKKPVEYVEIEKGTHHMVNAEARLTALTAAEKFLKQYLD